MTTLSECQLLSLDVADFRRLLEGNPSLKATITRTAEERLGVLMAGLARTGHPDRRSDDPPAGGPAG